MRNIQKLVAAAMLLVASHGYADILDTRASVRSNNSLIVDIGNTLIMFGKDVDPATLQNRDPQTFTLDFEGVVHENSTHPWADSSRNPPIHGFTT